MSFKGQEENTQKTKTKAFNAVEKQMKSKQEYRNKASEQRTWW